MGKITVYYNPFSNKMFLLNETSKSAYDGENVWSIYCLFSFKTHPKFILLGDF
jgi:hypothetical protein